MTRLKHGAVVFAHDVERLTAFYRETMALEVTLEEGGLAVLERDGFELVVHAIPPHIAATITMTDPPPAIEDANVKLIFPVDDFARARAAAAQHGGRFHDTGEEWEWRGIRACDGVDPEGNVIQIRRAATA